MSDAPPSETLKWYDPEWPTNSGVPRGFYKVSHPPPPTGPPVILRRMTEEEIIKHRAEFAEVLSKAYWNYLEKETAEILDIREANMDIHKASWLAVAEAAENWFAEKYDDPQP